MTNLLKPVVFNPEGGTNAQPQWSFAFDANGQLASVSDPKNHASQFTYDQLGRTVSHKLPMGQTASQMYDAFGRTFRKIDFKGQTNEFVYDAIGRLGTNQLYAPGSGTPNVAATYSYDSQDRIQHVVEPRGTNAFVYDKDGHVTQISSPEGIINYEYEPIEGRRTRVYTANSDLRYGYDLLGRVSTVSVFKRAGVVLATPEVTTNAYTALGSSQDVYYPNGVHAAYQYDSLMNRLTNLTYTSGSGLLAQYQYASGTNGQWKTATEIQRQVNGTYATNQLAWFYDNLGRLTNETCGSSLSTLNYTNRYVYNLVGNRLWATNIAGGVTTVIGYTYNTNDQLITDGSFTNWYDANGSMTNRSSLSEQNAYAYNLQNRLAMAVISRTDSGQSLSETANFIYDYHGNRVRSAWARNIGGNGTNIFLYEPNSPVGMSQVLEELPAIGATPSVSYTLGTRVVSQGKGGTISHFLPDGHGSTRQLANANASITARYTYDAYGKGLDFTNNTQTSTPTALLYSGGRNDPDLLQYSLGARYYNPAIGRFNQIDPFSPNQRSGGNLYAYGADDPINNSDPSGLYEIDVHQYLTRFLAEKAQFGDKAIAIGRETQSPDEDDRVAVDWLSTWNNMRDYHFVTPERLIEMASKANITDPYRIGEFLHAQEDTYAHCTGQYDRNWTYIGGDNGGFSGHACFGHDPDHTWLKPEKAMQMARRVYIDLKNLKRDGKFSNSCPDDTLDDVASSPDPAKVDWSGGDADTIAKFIWFNPGSIKGGMTKTWFGWNTVTQAGYLAKIQILFPGYSLKEGDAAYLNKLTPVKPLLTPRMQGLAPHVTTDMTIGGIIGGNL